MPQYAITTELSTIGNIPEGEIGYIQLKYDMKNRNYSEDEKYRDEFKTWIEGIWSEKDQKISELKF